MLHFTASPQRDPDGNQVRAILTAHFAWQRAREARSGLVHALAVLGGVLAFCVAVPYFVSEHTRHALAMLWGVCALCTAVAVLAEWVCYRRQAQLLASTPREPNQ